MATKPRSLGALRAWGASASLPHRLPRVTWPQFWSPVVRRNAMNVFCSSHTMKSFPLLVLPADAARPPSENSLGSNPRPPLALLVGGNGGGGKLTRRIRPASGKRGPERQRLTLWEVEGSCKHLNTHRTTGHPCFVPPFKSSKLGTDPKLLRSVLGRANQPRGGKLHFQPFGF